MKLKSTINIFPLFFTLMAFSQIGTRFPSEKKIIKDPVTGQERIFLTTKSAGDSKTYPTHPQWTADGEWLIFRTTRANGEAVAVNEKSGVMVQVTEGGYTGTSYPVQHLESGRTCFLLGNRREVTSKNLDSDGRRNWSKTVISGIRF